MPDLHTSQLPNFVEAVNRGPGGPDRPDIARQYYPVALRFDTKVDQSLSPFSEEYFQQQIALYREITGRELDQESGERHFDDIGHLAAAPNPIGMAGPDMAESVRSLSAMLSLAALEGGSDILDMGAGHGVSSEIFAYAGYRVHAIDIDPLLSQLSASRSQPRALDITRSTLNFDDLGTIENGKYAAAFFFQSLHHCLKPWQLIADLGAKLGEDGVIGFSGEPIQATWWRHWGLRLDGGSLYWMRGFGWFESGWSHDFIRECFARSGMTLMFFNGGYMGSEIGMAAASERRRDAILKRAAQIGLQQIHGPGEVALSEGGFATQIGEPVCLLGSRGFGQSAPGQGTLLFGPYVTLAPGEYEASLLVRRTIGSEGSDAFPRLSLDIVSALGTAVHACVELDDWPSDRTQEARLRFRLPAQTADVELRAIVAGGDLWAVSLPRLRRLQVESAPGQKF